MLNWNLHSFQLLEIIQVLDSISWVRCASGNVLYFHLHLTGDTCFADNCSLIISHYICDLKTRLDVKCNLMQAHYIQP